MKKLFALCLCCVCGIALFGAQKNHTILFYPESGALEFISRDGTVSLEAKTRKSGKHWYRLYFYEESPEWKEYKLVVKPAADGEILLNLRAPGNSVAEFGSVKIDGEEKLTEPVVIPYTTKGQKGVDVKCSGTKDKEMIILVKIRKSAKSLADFAQK